MAVSKRKNRGGPQKQRKKLVEKARRVKSPSEEGSSSGARAKKEALIEQIHECLDTKGVNIFLVEIKNQKNAMLKEVRESLKPGRLFFGRNKVIKFALSTQDKSLGELGAELCGERGLIFTQKTLSELQALLRQHRQEQFASAGYLADRTVVLEPNSEKLGLLHHSLEARLRALGLPTKLQNGQIVLLGKHTVCKEGKHLTVEQAQLLKHLDIKMGEFEVKVVGALENGKYRRI